MTEFKLGQMPDRRLLALFAGIMKELRSRGVVRTANNPVADYAERLVARAFELELASRSTKGYDAWHRSSATRYEVKSRRVTPYTKGRRLSPIRDLPEHHFDYLVVVVFDEDFSVRRACRMPFEVAERLTEYNEHVNGWMLRLADTLWDSEGVEDVTQQVQAAQKDETDE